MFQKGNILAISPIILMAIMKQECIPVGCLTLTTVAISNDTYAPCHTHPFCHACPLPCMSPYHAPPPCRSPLPHTPYCHVCPPAMHTPLPCTPPTMHNPPHIPPCQACPLPHTPSATHAPSPVDRQTPVKA